MNQKQKFLNIADNLIKEAESVINTQFETNIYNTPFCVDIQVFHNWLGKIKSFVYQLGTAANPWQEIFSRKPHNSLSYVKVLLGTIESIRHEIENDYLQTLTQLVKAETLADLLDQGEHLFENGYNLAAGVIGRAVLEEHLRTVCFNLDCVPTKKRPTINDYNQALYGIQFYSKVKMKQIDTLATIGNNAAHNNSDLNPLEIKQLLNDLPEIIESTRV